MKLEQIKSWLLTGLVLLSMILFWNLVTFQQNYDSITNPGYINDINIAPPKKEIKELIVPNKIIYRENSQQYQGTEVIQNIKPLISEVSKWSIYDFQISGNEFRGLFLNNKDNGVIIINYPDDIPLNLVKSLFRVDNTDIPEGYFNAAYIFPDQFNQGEGNVFFATSDYQMVIKARVRYQSINEFMQAFEEFKVNSLPYMAFEKRSGSYLYLPNGSNLILRNYYYYPRNYDVENFKDALFYNPSIVSFNGNQYSDTSSLLEVYETGLLSYVDPTVSKNYISINDLITSSVSYINEHSGWTDRYYYSSSNPTENEIIYQLYLNDYPVFNGDGLSQIKLIVGSQGVYSYDRPYFSLDIPTTPSIKEYQLAQGEEIMAYLDGIEQLDIQQIEEIVIGYYLTKAYDKQIIQLEPSWFYKLHNRWIRITDEELGGGEDGLE